MARILKAAATIFLKKGYAKTALSEIATAASVTKSLIYHHFGSKKELWLAVKESLFKSYCDEQMAMIEARPEPNAALMRDSLEGYFRFLQSRPEIPRLLGWIALEGGYSPGKQEKDLFARALEALEVGRKTGEVREDLDPAMILALFDAVTEYWMLGRPRFAQLAGLEPSPELDQRYLETMVKVFVVGVRGR